MHQSKHLHLRRYCGNLYLFQCQIRIQLSKLIQIEFKIFEVIIDTVYKTSNERIISFVYNIFLGFFSTFSFSKTIYNALFADILLQFLQYQHKVKDGNFYIKGMILTLQRSHSEGERRRRKSLYISCQKPRELHTPGVSRGIFRTLSIT